MDRQVRRSRPGRLVPIKITDVVARGAKLETIVIDAEAFIPEPLPPRGIDHRDLRADFYQPIVDAERALSELNGAAKRMPNPHVLIGPFLQREAILSSRIENTIATPEEVALFESAEIPEDRREEVEEVVNYIRALEGGLESTRPLGTNLIKSLHRTLLRGVRGQRSGPGEFRRSQNYIGSKIGSEIRVRYVPPPANLLDDLFKDFDEFLHAETEIPRLIRLAMTHYQFEAIHPFNDGNGRVGRLLITLQLCRDAQLDQPLVYLSGYFEEHRQRYNDLLLAVSQRGEWYAWFAFFLDAIQVQALDAQNRADQLDALQREYQVLVRKPRASAKLPTLIEALFASPWLNTVRAIKLTGVTDTAAANLVKKLEEEGILREATGRKRDRVWVADAILEIIHGSQDR